MDSLTRQKDAAKRDVIFQHETFNSKSRGSLKYGSASLEEIESGWDYPIEELLLTLEVFRKEGLIEFQDGRFYSTNLGRVERERHWQAAGRRHSALTSGKADLTDILIALVKSMGYESDLEAQHSAGIDDDELAIFLPCIEPECISVSVLALRDEGIVGRMFALSQDDPVRYGLTTKGLRIYAREVVSRLGIAPPATILAPDSAPRHRFDETNLSANMVDNLLYRWEEAERCIAAKAWLAANVLFGSILEALLQGWLERAPEQAMAAPSAPANKVIAKWQLHELIKVAVELGHIQNHLQRHADALRENRNLAHASRQVRERSIPDANLTAISKEVVQAVINLMAQAPN